MMHVDHIEVILTNTTGIYGSILSVGSHYMDPGIFAPLKAIDTAKCRFRTIIDYSDK
jgi:hypothetical protein